MTYSLNTLARPGKSDAGTARTPPRFLNEFALVIGGAALVYWLLALVSYSAQDPSFSSSGTGAPVANWAGRLGAWLADGSYFLFGFSVWWCFVAGVRAWLATLARWMRGGVETATGFWRTRLAFWIGLAVLLSASAGLEWSRLYRLEARLPDHAGGALGYLIGPAGVKWLGFTGSGLVFVALVVVSMLPAALRRGVPLPVVETRPSSSGIALPGSHDPAR